MGRNSSIRLQIKTDKQLSELVGCSVCGELGRYGSMFFRVDESNIKITENAKPVCKNCKNE